MGLSPTGMRLRVSLIYVCFVMFFGLVLFRLIQLQVWVNPGLRTLAKKQFESVSKKAKFRLPILDRNGEELAVSVPAGSVFARPRLITRKKEVAKRLAKLLGGPSKAWLAKLRTEKPFVWIRRQVSEELAERIDEENIPGIFVQPENKRVYPNESLAANTIGFTDIDGTGLAGLERILNDDLLSKQSQYQMIRDGKGTPSYIDRGYLRAQSEHTGIVTTIDRRLQNALEEELTSAMTSTGAKSILAIVMDPHTGNVYAMGQRPTFDPNESRRANESVMANRLVSYLYEPGSTMKVFFAAQAIETGLMQASTPVDCGNGEIKIGNKKIREAEASHRYPTIPLEKVIRFSSNVGAVRVVQKLGIDTTRATLEKFGFTGKTGIELPGEVSPGSKPPEFFTPFNLATVAFGQGIAVTPLQVVTAFASLANGGFAVKPHILMKSPGEALKETQRILSPKTVETMKNILVGVTEEKGGTGVAAAIPGLHIAGKTGTAQKYEAGAGYAGGKYFASFVGFLPAERPELVIGVMVDEPKTGYYASQVAAPLFKKIALRSLQILDLLPRRSLAQAESGTGGPVVRTTLPTTTSAPLLKPTGPGEWIMPDLKGVSMRDTLKLLGNLSTSLKLVGSGYLAEQIPKPGTPVTTQTPIVLSFSPEG
jgi:cell division protein FtsI (penicillin-binding protein 3)